MLRSFWLVSFVFFIVAGRSSEVLRAQQVGPSNSVGLVVVRIREVVGSNPGGGGFCF